MVADWRKGEKKRPKSQTFLGSEIRSFKPTMAYRGIDVRAFPQLKANTCPFTPWVREIVREKKKKIIKNWKTRPHSVRRVDLIGCTGKSSRKVPSFDLTHCRLSFSSCHLAVCVVDWMASVSFCCRNMPEHITWSVWLITFFFLAQGLQGIIQ